jgi:hypothetical protein
MELLKVLHDDWSCLRFFVWVIQWYGCPCFSLQFLWKALLLLPRYGDFYKLSCLNYNSHIRWHSNGFESAALSMQFERWPWSILKLSGFNIFYQVPDVALFINSLQMHSVSLPFLCSIMITPPTLALERIFLVHIFCLPVFINMWCMQTWVCRYHYSQVTTSKKLFYAFRFLGMLANIVLQNNSITFECCWAFNEWQLLGTSVHNSIFQ